MPGPKAQQQGYHHPRQTACYLCTTPFSTNNIRKTDLGSRKVLLEMVPAKCKSELVKGGLFTKQECEAAILQVCILCKGFVEQSFTVQERVRYLTNPPMLQWALKKMGWTIVRRERAPNGSSKMLHGLELLDNFDANSEECKAFKRRWLSVYPVYPAPLPYPNDGEELEGPDFLEMSEDDDSDDSEQESDEDENENENEDELSESERESDKEENEEEDGNQSGSDLEEEASEDELPFVKAQTQDHRDDSSQDSDNIAATLIASNPSTSKAVNTRHPSENHVVAKASKRHLPEARAEADLRASWRLMMANPATTTRDLTDHLHTVIRLEDQMKMILYDNNESAIEERNTKARIEELEKALQKVTALQRQEVRRHEETIEGLLEAHDRIDEAHEIRTKVEDGFHDRIHSLERLVPGATPMYKRKREDTPHHSDDRQSFSPSPSVRQRSIKHNSRATHSQETDEEDNGNVEQEDSDEDQIREPAPVAKRQKQHVNKSAARDPRTVVAQASTSRASAQSGTASGKNHLYLGREPHDLEMFSSNFLHRDTYSEAEKDGSGRS